MEWIERRQRILQQALRLPRLVKRCQFARGKAFGNAGADRHGEMRLIQGVTNAKATKLQQHIARHGAGHAKRVGADRCGDNLPGFRRQHRTAQKARRARSIAVHRAIRRPEEIIGRHGQPIREGAKIPAGIRAARLQQRRRRAIFLQAGQHETGAIGRKRKTPMADGIGDEQHGHGNHHRQHHRQKPHRPAPQAQQ